MRTHTNKLLCSENRKFTLDEVVGDVFKVVGRILGQIAVVIVFELLIKGPGYLLCKSINKSEPDPNGFCAVFSGMLFWLVLTILVLTILAMISYGDAPSA